MVEASPLRRDLNACADERFDLVVIGGGVFGACAALDAAQRGLKVALIEQGDWGGATSAHSYKMIHGGIRYVQHGDVVRVRHSARARRSFLKIAPHLCHPLPVVVPTEGRFGLKGPWALRAGMAVYDALTLDRNRGITDPDRRVPPGQSWSKAKVQARYPGLAAAELTGAGVFFDGQMYNPPRLVLALVRTAAAHGAVTANYLQAHKLITRAGRIEAVEAVDQVSQTRVCLRTSMVLNAAGPYAEALLRGALDLNVTPPTPFSRDTYFIVNRPLVEGHAALALPAQTSDPDAVVSRGARHLFLVPWHGATLVGVWHHVMPQAVTDFAVTEAELNGYLAEINQAYRGLDLSLNDISLVNAGLVPFGENAPGATHLKYAHRSRLIDHREHGIDGLVSLIGVRYTTGPLDAPWALDQLGQMLGRPLPPSRLTSEPLIGGEAPNQAGLTATIKTALAQATNGQAVDLAENFARRHGSAYGPVLQLAEADPSLAQIIGSGPHQAILAAEIAHAARYEMALTLSDIMFRRTDLATTGAPAPATIKAAASVMAQALGWDEERQAREIALVSAAARAARTGRMGLSDPAAAFQAAPAATAA